MEKDHSQVDLIKAKADIATIVSQYVQLKKVGQNYKGLCPFHSEKTPSFMVNSKIGIFKCFGCSKGGDVFNFIEEVEGTDFVHALQIVGDKVGIAVDIGVKSDAAETNEASYTVFEKAAGFYHQFLIQNSAAKSALEFLIHNRGVNLSTIKEFKLGLASSSGRELLSWAEKEKVDTSLLAKLSLLGYRDGRYFDWFRNRILFPICDSRGRVIAFSGRVLGDGEPKYLNSPENPLFNKSKTLFGLHLAKTEIKKQGFALMVEGNFDVVSSYQAGVKNTVAPLGTAATERHLVEIKKWTSNLYLGFDNDRAGYQATNKLAHLAIQNQMDVKVVALPTGKDPDEAAKADSAGWAKTVQNARPYYDFLIAKAVRSLPLSTAEGKKRFAQALLPLIAGIADPLEKNHYVKKIAAVLDETETMIIRLMSSYQAVHAKKALASTLIQFKPTQVSKDGRILKYLLALIIEAGVWPESLSLDLIVETQYRTLSEQLKIEARIDVERLRDRLDLSEKELLDEIVLVEIDDVLLADQDKLKAEIANLIRRLQEASYRRQLKALSLSIKQAEATQEEEKMRDLQRQFSDLIKALKSVSV